MWSKEEKISDQLQFLFMFYIYKRILTSISYTDIFGNKQTESDFKTENPFANIRLVRF